MAQTSRRTQVYEVVVATEDGAPLASGHERKQAGDIIGLRPVTAPQAGLVGSKERHRYLWLLMELTDEQAAALTQPVGGEVDEVTEVRAPQWEKRRYRIPLDRLAQILPGFSPARARNLADLYQPCCGLDEDAPYAMLTRARPLRPEGLVVDVVTGRAL
jgi:hypothetical protein